MPPPPTLADVHGYIQRLYEETANESKHFDGDRHVKKMKKTMIFIAQGIDIDELLSTRFDG